MRAKELWRIAPRLQMRIEPERVMAARRELMPPELQKKMVAAFERARTERLAAQIPQQGAGQASDPWTRANTTAFLILERERRAIAARLCSSYRHSGDRYRDLILVTKLLRLEYEHLAGRVGGRSGPTAPPNGLPVGGDMPADWARPWGSGPMVEIGTAFVFYRDQRDRLARQLSTPTVGSAAAEAAWRRDRILTRFERAMGQWRPELEHGMGAAADFGKRQAAAPIAVATGDEKRVWPWASLGFTRRAAAVAAVFAAVGVGAIFAQTRGGESAVSAPGPVVASVPEPLEAVGERLKSQPARGRGGRHGAAHRSRAPQGNAGGVRKTNTALSASEIPPAAPEPAPEAAAAPIAPAAPAATPAPPPPPPPDGGPVPKPQPDPKPKPAPKPRPGPVYSLPPPVGGLPAPGGPSDQGG
jgi:hypothetical protein